MSSSKINEAANPTQVLSTSKSLVWDDEMDEAFNELGAGSGYVIG